MAEDPNGIPVPRFPYVDGFILYTAIPAFVQHFSSDYLHKNQVDRDGTLLCQLAIANNSSLIYPSEAISRGFGFSIEAEQTSAFFHDIVREFVFNDYYVSSNPRQADTD